MLAQVFASSEMDSLPSAEAMSFACLFLGNMCELCSTSFFEGFKAILGVNFSFLQFKRQNMVFSLS
jgi:hypothetical protein